MLLSEEFSADICLLVELFRLQLHVDEVCIFEQAGELVQLLLLEDLELLVQRVEKVDNALPKLILQVKLFALCDLLTALNQVICSLVDILEEVLGGGFEQ